MTSVIGLGINTAVGQLSEERYLEFAYSALDLINKAELTGA